MKYIVVPEGLSINSKQTPIPSFIFRQVIEYLSLIIKKNDEIYFAPANSFGLGISEQIAGKNYFQEICENVNEIKIFYASICSKGYIDTLGNATLLKKQFPKLSSENIDLISANMHSKRAFFCFKSVGFNIRKLHKVQYEIVNEKIVRRLWYYKYPKFHQLYEVMAFIKDFINIKFYSNR